MRMSVSRMLAIAALCLMACAAGEQPIEETAETTQELLRRRCDVWSGNQLILDDGYCYPPEPQTEPEQCCNSYTCLACRFYDCVIY